MARISSCRIVLISSSEYRVTRGRRSTRARAHQQMKGLKKLLTENATVDVLRRTP